MTRRILPHLVGLLVLLVVACDQTETAEEAPEAQPAPTPAPASLYDRLGGEGAIRSVVDTMVAHAAGDAELNFTRAGTDNEWEATPENIATLKDRLVQFVGSATGGPQQYEGRDMLTAHQGMEITNEEFDRLGSHLQMSLQAHNVPAELQAELMQVVESTRAQIVAAADTAQ